MRLSKIQQELLDVLDEQETDRLPLDRLRDKYRDTANRLVELGVLERGTAWAQRPGAMRPTEFAIVRRKRSLRDDERPVA